MKFNTKNRRSFLSQSAAISVGFLGLHHFVNQNAQSQNSQAGFGPLISDPNNLLDLPEGFSYQVISRFGDTMSDGLLVPALPDGMAAFPASDGKTILIRNHELNENSANGSAFGSNNERLDLINREMLYDQRNGTDTAYGGTSTLLYNTQTQTLEAQWLSLGGTLRNCAGGPTPWNSWITCEESVVRQGNNGLQQDHGFNFEVPATESPVLHPGVAIVDMGRFNHEAIAVDPQSGVVYLTEDRGDGLIYRYIPNVPGQMLSGGRLQALAVRDQASLDTRNNSRLNPTVAIGESLSVDWIDLEDVLSPNDDLRMQGFSNGAARFSRGEGMWYGNNAIFFACTNGGWSGNGQIWKYIPSSQEGTAGESANPGTLELFIEPNDASLVQNADNLTVSPWGDLIICEDKRGQNTLVGVTPEGQLYKFARNASSGSEFAGSTFSQDGTTLFVNMQTDGLTFSITGPFQTSSVGDWNAF